MRQYEPRTWHDLGTVLVLMVLALHRCTENWDLEALCEQMVRVGAYGGGGGGWPSWKGKTGLFPRVPVAFLSSLLSFEASTAPELWRCCCLHSLEEAVILYSRRSLGRRGLWLLPCIYRKGLVRYQGFVYGALSRTLLPRPAGLQTHCAGGAISAVTSKATLISSLVVYPGA